MRYKDLNTPNVSWTMETEGAGNMPDGPVAAYLSTLEPKYREMVKHAMKSGEDGFMDDKLYYRMLKDPARVKYGVSLQSDQGVYSLTTGNPKDDWVDMDSEAAHAIRTQLGGVKPSKYKPNNDKELKKAARRKVARQNIVNMLAKDYTHLPPSEARFVVESLMQLSKTSDTGEEPETPEWQVNLERRAKERQFLAELANTDMVDLREGYMPAMQDGGGFLSTLKDVGKAAVTYFGDYFAGKGKPEESEPSPAEEGEKSLHLLDDEEYYKKLREMMFEQQNRLNQILSKDKGLEIGAELIRQGFSIEEAAAIIGNVKVESAGFQTDILGDLHMDTPSYGLMQWRGERLQKLRDMYGDSPTLQQQAEYMRKELKEGATKNQYDTKQFKKAMNVEDKTDVGNLAHRFAQYVERPSKAALAKSTLERQEAAEHYYDLMQESFPSVMFALDPDHVLKLPRQVPTK